MSLIDRFLGLFSKDPPEPASPGSSAKKESAGKVEPNLRQLILGGQLPAGMEFKTISLINEKSSFSLPPGLRCFGLDLSGSAITSIPPDLAVEFKLNLTNCVNLKELPGNLKTGSLVLTGCTGLASLPAGMEVNFLDLNGCTNLTHWPECAHVSVGSVRARGCASLEALPSSLTNLTNLDISGCSRIRSLPEGLRLTGWLDLAGTAIEGLPEDLKDVHLRWRGVDINARIAFFPETLSAAEILGERNAEVRRVMLERRGLDAFFDEAEATVLDEDTDSGGKRRLLKVALPGDEDLVCVSLICPSTGRRYVIRVPPVLKTCHAAVAWTAGFDNPNDYNPIVET